MNRFAPLTMFAGALSILMLLGAAPPHSGSTQPVHEVLAQSSDRLESIQKKCGVCHDGAKGYCGKKKTPAIAGLHKLRITKTLNNPPKAMKAVVRGMTDAEKTAIANWASALPKCDAPDAK